MDRYDPYTDKFLRDTQYDILGTNLAEVGTDLATKRTVKGFPIDADLLMLKVEEEYGFRARDRLYEIIRTMPKYDLPSAQPEIIRCKDCKYWVPGYITDNDDFIPPKCGEWQQMVGHSSDDYCSLAERREVTT